MFGLDPMYFIILAPALLLSFLASCKVKSAFAKYNKVRAFSGLTGAMAARLMLQSNGVLDVEIQKVQGFLTDNYNPGNKVLSLSPDVHDGTSLAAVGVACHEAGHALQHAEGYAPLHLRSTLVPVVNFSSRAAIFVFIAGIMMQLQPLTLLGVILFGAGFLFSVVTLPVEWNASARAKSQVVNLGIVSPDQEGAAGSVLNAAFLTYVAAAVSSLLTVFYYLLRSGLLNGRRD
ncbi:MAG: zinc metallopeptidase [Kiritimatiellae bacterium]|nr:zinc metallopeptidase [Kiritimatiellia bacterium]